MRIRKLGPLVAGALLMALIGLPAGVAYAAGAARYVNPDGQCGGNTPCYTTIQAAINAAAPGDAIQIAAATYPEQVVVNKAGLTLLGAGSTATIIEPASVSANTTSLTGGAAEAPILLVDGVTGVTIENLRVDGSAAAFSACAPGYLGVYFRDASGSLQNSDVRNILLQPSAHGCQTQLGVYVQSSSTGAAAVTLSNNAITNYGKNGITANEANTQVTITGNTVTGRGPTGPGDAGQNGIQAGFGATGSIANNIVSNHSYTDPNTAVATGILLYQADVSTSGNTLTENQVGLYDIEGSGTYSGNTVSASTAGTSSPYIWGIVVDAPPPHRRPSPVDSSVAARKTHRSPQTVQTVALTANILTGDDSSGGYGIEADAGYSDLNMALSASGNVVHHWGTGVTLTQCASGCGAGSFSGAAFTSNDLSSNGSAFANSSPFLADASGNWWGSHDAATVAQAAGSNVDYTPWLNTGTDTDSNAPGFQGDFSFLNVGAGSPQSGSAGRIQEGANLTSSGGTVAIGPGTFIENVTVTQTLTLSGTGQASTTVQPALLNPDCRTGGGGSLCGGAASNIVLVQADQVTIHDLTLDGDNPNLHSGVSCGGADVDARNGIITNHLAGTYQNLTVYNTTIKNIYLRGVYASSGGSFDFHDDTVQNVQCDPASIAMFNFGGAGTMQNNTVTGANDAISSNHSRGVQFLDNTITNSASGVHTDNAGDGGGTADLIRGNTVSTCTTDGYGVFVFVPYLAPSVMSNTVTSCAVGLAAYGGGGTQITSFSNNTVDGAHASGSTGAFVTTDQLGYGANDVYASFTGNTIINNDTGVDVQAQNPAVAHVTAHYNDIYGNSTAGFNNEAPALVDAINNWWGSASGPTNANNPGGTGDRVIGNVSFDPWLGQSIHATPTPTSTPSNTPAPTNTPSNTPAPTNTPTNTPVVNATCTPVDWQNAVNVAVSGDTITKTGPNNAWDAGASSATSLASGDGSVSATVVSTSTYAMFGLSNMDTNAGYAEIKFAIYTYPVSGQVLVFESGTYRGSFGPYAAGDTLKVAVESGQVKYYRNSTLLYTSGLTPSYPLLVDSSIYTPGGQISVAQLCGDHLVGPPAQTCNSVAWQNQVNASAAGGTLTKTGPNNAWDAGASSTLAIGSGDGSVSASVLNTSTYAMFGLSNADTNQNYTEIKYAIYTYPVNGQVLVFESGVYKGSFGTYLPGDTLKVAVQGGQVKYFRNGGLLYTSTVAPTYPLLVDSSIYTPNGAIANAQLCGSNLVSAPLPQNVVWTHPYNVTLNGNSLTKSTGGNAWNAGAVSNLAIASGDGFVQASIAAHSDYVMFGLSNGDTDQSYADIDYAIYPYPVDGHVYVFEGGTIHGPVSNSYAAGDVLKVAVVSGQVRYYQNGTLLYTSAVAPTYPLLLDSSLYNVGAQVQNASIAGNNLTGVTAPFHMPLAPRVGNGPAVPAEPKIVPNQPLIHGVPELNGPVVPLVPVVPANKPAPAAPHGPAVPANPVVPGAGPFRDVAAGSPLAADLACLTGPAGVQGYADGTFRPDAAVTRGQVAAIIARAAGLAPAAPASRPTFADVPAGSPFGPVVEGLAHAGLVKGYRCGGAGEPCDAAGRPYFRPAAPATRGQVAALLAGAARLNGPIPAGRQTFADVASGNTTWLAVERLAAAGLAGGYPDAAGRRVFRPDAAATRGQVVMLSARVFFAGCAAP